MNIRPIFISVCLLGLTACVNTAPTPDSFYYVLEPVPVTSKNMAAPQDDSNTSLAKPAAIVKLMPLNVPDYLNQPNLVLKLEDHQIKIANYHFWAEDLRTSTHRILVNETNARSETTRYAKRCIDCDELTITIDHFYPTESGDVFLAGSFEIAKRDGTSQYADFKFNRNISEGGYNAAVAKMRMLLNDLAQRVTEI